VPAHSRSKNGVASLAYVAGIYVLNAAQVSKTWMAATSQNKSGHDRKTNSI